MSEKMIKLFELRWQNTSTVTVGSEEIKIS
jgi:hypothetical protein